MDRNRLTALVAVLAIVGAGCATTTARAEDPGGQEDTAADAAARVHGPLDRGLSGGAPIVQDAGGREAVVTDAAAKVHGPLDRGL